MKTLFVAALAISGLAALPALAEYPDHSIQAVVGFAPGAGNDVMARIVMPLVAKILGQSILVVNKAGAAGTIAAADVAHAKPDGYPWLIGSSDLTQNYSMYNHLTFDYLKDFVPVAELGHSVHILATNIQNVPAKTLPEFIELLKKNPGKYNAATDGNGQAMNVQLFEATHGVKVNIVNYNGTSATALMQGEADFLIGAGTTIAPGIASGKVRGLAVLADDKLAAFPDVPTMKQQGVTSAGYQDLTPFSVLMPKGTPPEIVTKVNAAVQQAVATPEVKAQFDKLGLFPDQKNQPDFAKFYQSQVAMWHDIVTSNHIPPLDGP